MSKTTDFIQNFNTFMAGHSISVPNSADPDDLGGYAGWFTLAASRPATLVAVMPTGGQPSIPAFLLRAMANQDNTHVLALPPNVQEGYMFTSEMSGCQFIAYGPDRQTVTVEHNNYIDEAHPDEAYARRLQACMDQHPAYSYHISATRGMHSLSERQYSGMIQVVGHYTQTGGWSFFVSDFGDGDKQVYGPF